MALAKLNTKPVKLLCLRCAASWSSGSKGPGVNVNGCALTAATATRPRKTTATCDLRHARAACQVITPLQ